MAPLTLTYEMLTGWGERAAPSKAEALFDYRELQRAGAGRINIYDHHGRIVTLDDLMLATPPLNSPKSRTEPDV